MKVEIGEYLRLDNGDIYKWESNDYEWINEEDGQPVYGNGANEYEWESDIIKHSFNIIDLIEKNDLVVDNYGNIYVVDYVFDNYIYTTTKQGNIVKTLCDYQIKSIVTHEQFESMEYKVGE